MAEFVNPYVFFPIGEKVERAEKTQGNLSGRIDCTLEIKSPTFIPNTTKLFADKENNNHFHKAFFSYDDLSKVNDSDYKSILIPKNPVIPGSEIRGMIRNIYEQLTNSCFTQIDEFNLPYKRTNEPRVLCMMVNKDDEWYVYPLRKPDSNPRFDNNFYGINGVFECSRSDNYDLKKKYKYVRVPRKNMSRKYIYYTDENLDENSGYKLPPDALKRLEYVMGLDKNVKGGYAEDIDEKNKYQKKEPFIVYADKESVRNRFKGDSTIYLSTSQITKEFFSNKIGDILEKNNEHQPCTGENKKFCPACRLFGMVGSKDTVKGSLRFTDTYYSDEIAYDNEQTLPILGQPRISSTEFYLKKPNNGAKMWNYDYYTIQDSRKQYTPELAGRKVYWNGDFKSGAEKSNMNSTVTPLTKGKFNFSVYFDRISEDELDNLIFCLALEDKNNTVHKIGTGKPIGMGQVKLTITNVQTIKYSSELNREDTDYTYNLSKIKDKKEAKLILKYSTDQSFKNIIDYPRERDTRGNENIFTWFANNRGGVNKAQIKQILKPLSEKETDYSLKRNQASNGNGGSHGGNGFQRNGTYRNGNNNKWDNNHRKKH